MSAKAKAVRAKHKAKVHASPEWAAKKAKVKATHAAKVKAAQAGVKKATGGSGYSAPTKAPKGFTTTPPSIGRTSPGAGAANRARQGAITGAAKRGGGFSSKGVSYKKPSKAKRLKV
tara:strand:+ start:197 stop:547 length:351 start_codon:yes stop_codon:yes gene_type:complete